MPIFNLLLANTILDIKKFIYLIYFREPVMLSYQLITKIINTAINKASEVMIGGIVGTGKYLFN